MVKQAFQTKRKLKLHTHTHTQIVQLLRAPCSSRFRGLFFFEDPPNSIHSWICTIGCNIAGSINGSYENIFSVFLFLTQRTARRAWRDSEISPLCQERLKSPIPSLFEEAIKHPEWFRIQLGLGPFSFQEKLACRAVCGIQCECKASARLSLAHYKHLLQQSQRRATEQIWHKHWSKRGLINIILYLNIVFKWNTC